jgi:pyruvate dehydrogenase E1 component alpha subunit
MKPKARPKPPVSPVAETGFSLISRQKLLDLYTAMLRCRMIAERAHKRFKKSKAARQLTAGALHEAAAAAIVIDLLPDDVLTVSPRNPIPGYLKGQPLAAVLSAIQSESAGGDLALGILPGATPIAARLQQANGVALAHKLGGSRKIVVAFSEGAPASFDPLCFAAAHELPIVFVAQTSVPAGRTVNVDAIAERAEACGVFCIPVDGDDVVAVYRVAGEAIVHARRGSGPTLVECRVGHGGKGDPIANMERYLTEKGIFQETFKRKVVAEFNKELDVALRRPGK